MKSKLAFVFVLIFCFVVNSQKKYTFDYIVEYESQRTEKSKKDKEIVLFNSNDVSYICYVREKDKLNFDLVFLDLGSLGSRSVINKEVFYKSGTINLSCNSIEHYKRYENENHDNRFDFKNIADTLIDGKYYRHYIVEYHDKKEAKSSNWVKSHVILERNTGYEKPLFILLDMAEATQKAIKIIPNGIPKEVYSLTYKKSRKEFAYKLVNYEKTDIDLVIPEECLIAKGLQGKSNNP